MTMSDNVSDNESMHCRIPPAHAGKRLDLALAELLPDFSRNRLQHWIKSGHIQVDGQLRRPRDPVLGGEEVRIEVVQEVHTEARAQAIPLAICFQDDDMIVINKAAGMVVHPAAGNPEGTLVNALLHHDPALDALPRAGLVHRLDKETSGLLVVARRLTAYTSLVKQLQARSMGREYQAVVNGVLSAGGSIEAAIGRHPVDRKRMAVVANGKPALTHYRVIQRFHGHTHLRVWLETGRTHQIRVHLASIRHPLLGDPVYGGRLKPPPQATAGCLEILQNFRRQALHASRLSLRHPSSGRQVEWQAELPQDMRQLLMVLEENSLEKTP